MELVLFIILAALVLGLLFGGFRVAPSPTRSASLGVGWLIVAVIVLVILFGVVGAD